MSVSLRPVIECNISDLAKLSMSEEDMNHSQVGSVKEIIERAVEQGTDVRGVYSDNTLVGLIHHSAAPYDGFYDLYHFFIDRNYRRRGYGESALRLLIEEVRQQPNVTHIRLSYMSFNDTGALELYGRLGFVPEDADDDEPGERTAVLPFQPQSHKDRNTMRAEILEPAILININRSFSPGMSESELYEATRKDWVISPHGRSPQPRYALAVYQGIVRQVFEIDSWHLSQDRPGRLYFAGRVAASKANYIGQSVKHIKPGASNPIKYINC